MVLLIPDSIALDQCLWQLEEDEKSAGRCCLLAYLNSRVIQLESASSLPIDVAIFSIRRHDGFKGGKITQQIIVVLMLNYKRRYLNWMGTTSIKSFQVIYLVVYDMK
jgi:hypothetical protein